MPRGPRLDAPGSLHHIMVRGIERKKIFESERDKEDFLTRLGKVVQEGQATCFAWVLIPTHALCTPQNRSDPPGKNNETIVDWICCQFQSASSTIRASFSEPL